MSSFPRNPPGPDRKPTASTAGSTRQRGTQSSHDTRQNSVRTTKESVAASHAERRTERTQTISTRETVAVRTVRSPLKPATDNRPNVRKSKDMGKPPKPVEPVAMSPKKQEQPMVLPWDPMVSIVPNSSAPLASRVSIPPLASTAPNHLAPQPLTELSKDKQEAAIIEDLLFIFMGLEGEYIRFAETYNPGDETDRLCGPTFKLLPGLDPSLRDLTTSMLKMATHYVAVEAFVEVLSREEYGAVNHALCAAIRKLLKEYLVLMAQLEHQMLTNTTFTLHLLNLHTKPTSHMLFQLYTLGTQLLKANSILEDNEAEESMDETDDLQNILETLKEGGTIGDTLPGRKVCKGGNALGLITRRLAAMSGDPSAKTLLTTLLREASRPYMVMLNEWLHHGGIKDPHAEFLVKEQKSIKRERLDQDYTDEYWEKRYTLRDNLVPPQLEGVKDKVLLAGKYLNVVRECGGVDISKVVEDVPTSFDDPRFLENVNSAYTYANSELLTLLLTTHALPARLRSLKHYFFLDRSDFFSYFLELGNSELRKQAKLVNIGKLQSLLDIVVRQPGSVAAEDPFKEDVKVAINEVSLVNWLMKIVNVTGLDQDGPMGTISNYLTPATQPAVTDDKDITGYEALVFDYTMPFPLSLVVSRVTLTRYQLLFRYLLSLRHLETVLANSWTEHSKGRSWKHRSKNPRIEAWKRRAWTLRARMLIFVQQLLYYCTSEVIEPNWEKLTDRLAVPDVAEHNTAGDRPIQPKRTVDELMQDHVDFLATCLKECMLTNAKLLKVNSKILSTCNLFAHYTSSLSKYLIQADSELSAAEAKKPIDPKSKNAPITYDPARVDKMFDVLKKYEDNFSRHLKIMLDTLNYLAATETVVFLSLCARLSTASDGVWDEGF